MATYRFTERQMQQACSNAAAEVQQLLAGLLLPIAPDCRPDVQAVMLDVIAQLQHADMHRLLVVAIRSQFTADEFKVHT